MKKMYRGVTNSPKTELVTLITETDTEIEVNDISVLLPNEGVAVIGNGDVAETIKYSEVEGNVLKRCIRGYEGIARSWTAGTRVARNFTAGDWNTAIDNIEDLYGRLDDKKKVPLALQPGLQVVTSAKDARFKLGQIIGKTEINGQGRTGIVGVENPYVIGIAGNLLPPFYEWSQNLGNGRLEIISKYECEVIGTSTNSTYFYFDVSVKTETDYAFKAEHNGYISIIQPDDNVTIVGNTNAQSVVFNTGPHTKIRIFVSNYDGSEFYGRSFTFKNPMLFVGSEAKPFEPQHKTMLAFQTELHANPADGSEPDVLFEQDGHYFERSKWKKLILDGGSLPWLHDYGTAVPGSKVLFVRDSTISARNFISFVTKYDGTLLINRTEVSFTGPDQSLMYLDGIHVTVANTDSGWGPDYLPTQDEIKAYFMGWKMYDVNVDPTGGGVYNRNDGEGKWWVPIDRSSGGVSTLPTMRVPSVPSYQLLYRLSRETVESAVSEGALLLNEGDNVVEVGTGIVLREKVNPVSFAGTHYLVNHIGYPSSWLKYKADKIKEMYRDNLVDLAWQIIPGDAYGNERINIITAEYVQTAAYTATYIKLDKSPAQPIIGSLAANEKAQISDLTTGVAEALQRVSVVEQKKADEDEPGWLTPTLLNGATSYGSSIPQYVKIGNRVYLRGQVVLTALNTTIFKLPEGYRPDRFMRFLGYSYTIQTAPGEIVVMETGDVVVPTGGLAATSFDGISFLAK